MDFRRTEDYDLVRRIVTHPQLWPHVSDDASGRAEDYQPPRDRDSWYVLVRDAGELLGMFVFRMRPEYAEVHTCLLPDAWGARALQAAREVIGWLFTTAVDCPRILTAVPTPNRLALRLARKAGLRERGRFYGVYQKNGVAFDEIVLGIEREEWTCQ